MFPQITGLCPTEGRVEENQVETAADVLKQIAAPNFDSIGHAVARRVPASAEYGCGIDVDGENAASFRSGENGLHAATRAHVQHCVAVAHFFEYRNGQQIEIGRRGLQNVAADDQREAEKLYGGFGFAQVLLVELVLPRDSPLGFRRGHHRAVALAVLTHAAMIAGDAVVCV